VLINPISFNIRNNGSIVTCAGIIIELNNKLNNLSLPAKRYLAKAYPAIELKKRDTTVTITDKAKLLMKFLATFNLENKFWNWEKVNSSGMNLGGYVLACPSYINEADTIQMNGASVINPVITKKV